MIPTIKLCFSRHLSKQRPRRDSNSRPPPWQGGALTNWATGPDKWTFGDSNPGPIGYEPIALTNWAKGPKSLSPVRTKPMIGLEPITCWLQISCSANWATSALMTPTGIEPVLPPWKGDVLTAWPWSQIPKSLVSLKSFLKRPIYILSHDYCFCKYFFKILFGILFVWSEKFISTLNRAK